MRNVSLDVFRCLSMFAIVLGHAYKHRTGVDASQLMDVVYGLFLMWHVDAFLSLSGWFGVRFAVKKFLKLWCLIAFYSVISILVGRLFLGEVTRLGITGGWYGNTYLCLMLVSPLLNAGVEGLAVKGKKVLAFAWCGFAVVMWVNWLSGNSYLSLVAYDIGPCSLVQMVFVYVTVRVVRLTGLNAHVRLWHLAVILVAFIGGCLILPYNRTNYIAPHVVAMAVALLLFFEKFARIPDWIGRICVWAAPSMFGVYLIHEVSSYGKMFHRMPVEWLLNHGTSPAISIFCGAAFCFLICLMLEWTRSTIVSFVQKRMIKHAG